MIKEAVFYYANCDGELCDLQMEHHRPEGTLPSKEKLLKAMHEGSWEKVGKKTYCPRCHEKLKTEPRHEDYS